jgi:hypothetical protein
MSIVKGTKKFLGFIFLFLFSFNIFSPLIAFATPLSEEILLSDRDYLGPLTAKRIEDWIAYLKERPANVNDDAFVIPTLYFQRTGTERQQFTWKDLKDLQTGYNQDTGIVVDTKNEEVERAELQEKSGCVPPKSNLYVFGVLTFWGCTAVYNIFQFFIGLAGGILFLAAKTFDLLVGGVIVGTANILGDGGSDNVFYKAWSVIRDLFNIVGFFAAIFAGVMRIFGADKEEFKKVIFRVILFALLTNFSYPITRSLIDFSNIISLNIYGGIVDYELAETFGDDAGVSLKLMKEFGISSLITEKSNLEASSDSPLSKVNGLGGTVIVIFFLIFLTSIMVKACIFVLGRIATLMICVITSPLMFIGGLVPKLNEFHDQWRKNFFDSLIVGPMLMISLWLGLKIMEGAAGAIKSIDPSSGFSVLIQTAFSGIVFYYCIKLTEKYAGQIGQFGANVLGKFTNTITGGAALLAGGAALGMGGMAFRNIVGRPGNAIANSDYVKNTDSNSNIFKRAVAGSLKSVGTAAANTNIGKGRGNSFAAAVKNKTEDVMSGDRKDLIIKDPNLKAEYKTLREKGDLRGLEALKRKADLLNSKDIRDQIKDGKVTREDVLSTNNSSLFNIRGSKAKFENQIAASVQERAIKENNLRTFNKAVEDNKDDALRDKRNLSDENEGKLRDMEEDEARKINEEIDNKFGEQKAEAEKINAAYSAKPEDVSPGQMDIVHEFANEENRKINEKAAALRAKRSGGNAHPSTPAPTV